MTPESAPYHEPETVEGRPRLLAVSGVAPWPVRGGFSLRAAHLLEGLAVDWDVSLIVCESTDPTLAAWPAPNRHEITTVSLAARWSPVPSGRDGFDLLRKAVEEAIARRQPDAALLFNGSEFLAFDRRDFPPAVADRIDCGALERFRYIRRSRYLRPLKTIAETVAEARYERRLVRELAHTTVVGEDDAKMLRRVSGRDSIHVIHNGVHALDAPAFEEESGYPTVAFTGTLSYYANVDAVRYFVREVWPSVRARVEGARLVVAGRTPSKKVLALEDCPGVEIRPDVSDMREVLRESWVAVAPMRCGAGVKNKVLEAWAVGRPAVLLPRAANGLILEEPASDLVAASPAEFGDWVVRLLQDAELRHRHGAAAQDQVRRRQTWARSAEALSDLLRTVARERFTSRDPIRTPV